MPGRWPPTSDEILNVAADGVHMRADRFRFDLEDPQHRVIGELHPYLDQKPTLSNDSSRSVFRTVQNFHLPPSEGDAIDTMSDRVRIWMILQDNSEWPLGSYLWADSTHPLREWGAEEHSVLTDLSDWFNMPYGGSTGSPKGRNHVQRAIDYAISAAVGWPLDEITSVPSARAVVKAPLAWTPTDLVIDIINDHLELADYFPAHFDHTGQLVYRPMPFDIDNARVDVAYNRPGHIVRDTRTQSDDLLHAPNEFRAFDSSGQGTPVLGVYRIDESAPHSAAKRGRTVRKVEAIQGLADVAAAEAAARNLAIADKHNTFDWQTWTTPNDPRHDTFMIVALEGVNYLEVATQMELVPTGKMTHQARRPYF